MLDHFPLRETEAGNRFANFVSEAPDHNLIEQVFMSKGAVVDIIDSNFPGLKVRIFPQDFYLHYFGTKVKVSRVPG